MDGYAIGDVVGFPPEPPVGAILECGDECGEFRVARDERGWFLVGVAYRRYRWTTVLKLWVSPEYPARVVALPS